MWGIIFQCFEHANNTFVNYVVYTAIPTILLTITDFWRKNIFYIFLNFIFPKIYVHKVTDYQINTALGTDMLMTTLPIYIENTT